MLDCFSFIVGMFPLVRGCPISKIHKINYFVFMCPPTFCWVSSKALILGHRKQMSHLPVKWQLARGRKEARALEVLRAPTTLRLELQRRFSGLKTAPSF